MKLETSRLILREWTKKDVSDLVEGLNNLEVTKWLATAPYPYTKKDAEEFIKKAIKQAKEKERTNYEFAIELKDGKKVIGGVTLKIISKFHKTAGGGIWTNAKYHGHGYGTEAFSERIRFAFEELGLRKLENGYFEGNKQSKKMQESFGYKIEGIKRETYKCMANGQIKDEIITGLLKREWKRN